MVTWKNLDTLASYKEMQEVARVNLVEAMTGENGAERVKKYSVPMAEGMAFNYGAKQVDDDVLAVLAKFAKEAQLTEKFAALYNGEVINTGEKRLVLHHMTRGQLGEAVVADGVSAKNDRLSGGVTPDNTVGQAGILYVGRLDLINSILTKLLKM